MNAGGEDNTDARTVLLGLWAHHWWSLDLIIEAARPLGEAEFARDLRISYGSFHGALAHLVGSEQVWLARVRRGESPAKVPGPAELPDLTAIEQAWERCKLEWREVLECEDLGRSVVYRNTRGEEFDDPLWLVATHLADHGAAYRGVLVAALRLLGRTPPTTGLIFYNRQQK